MLKDVYKMGQILIPIKIVIFSGIVTGTLRFGFKRVLLFQYKWGFCLVCFGFPCTAVCNESS